MSKVYDVIVLGAGPAGLAAGLYAGRSRKVKMADRSQSQMTSKIILDRS
jgi:thioredoxin reductase